MNVNRNVCLHWLLVSLFLISAVSCAEKSQQPFPKIELGDSQVLLPYDGGSVKLSIDVNRDWQAVYDADWLAIDPAEGGPEVKEVTVTSLKNDAGAQRSCQVIFKTSSAYTRLGVVQEADPAKVPYDVYVNDFDVEKAVEENGRWPYLDQTEIWKNETGKGAGNVKYYSSSVSVRSNSGSSGSYSEYEGSGDNNLFFGKESYFVIADLELPDDYKSYSLSFGTEKYQYGSSSNVFDPKEFPVMVSVDGNTWVSLEYTFALGHFSDGKWDLATAHFTLPEAGGKLWIRFASTLESVHRLDDVSLVSDMSGEESQKIDWSKGVQITVPEK